MEQLSGRSGGRWAGLGLAAGMLLLAAVVAIGASGIPSSSYAVVGPRVMPLVLAALMALFGVLLLLQALRGQLLPESFGDEPLDLRGMGWVALGLVLNVATIKLLGFSAASMLLFVCIARGFGSRAPLRDAVIGLVLALAAFLGFSRLLGVDFGGGVIEGLF